jgi:hypothetical protein
MEADSHNLHPQPAGQHTPLYVRLYFDKKQKHQL